MVTLSWNEIVKRAISFSKEWENTTNEDAEAKPFMEEFLKVFGVHRHRVAQYEYRVKKLDDADGYIDLLWKGVILIEMKSRGKNLDKAFLQAKEYLAGLKDHELPRYILICDFNEFRLFDADENTTIQFTLPELFQYVKYFASIAGYQKRTYTEQDPVNIRAAEMMGKLHDQLKESNYSGHDLEVYLVRILFCLFAEDTTIFDKQQFQNLLEERTCIDGSDVGNVLAHLFQILDTPKELRQKNTDEQLNDFRYVNGKLFSESLKIASFNSEMRQTLIECCHLDWSKISPAIFGSMFQSVMNPAERRNLGAHYTSEQNILKVIKPLFMDALWDEFNTIKGNRNKLNEFHKKISLMRFLDPACGCGNFLVITYRELRLLELEILRVLYASGEYVQTIWNVENVTWLDVDMMIGIECEEFPVRIAEVAMWLIDHQMNMAIGSEFGEYFVRLPLKKHAKIIHGNALRISWEEVVAPREVSYILGNPPFSGKSLQNDEQKKDMASLFMNKSGTGVLDYVTAWYVKAAMFIQNKPIRVGFVSTNSISQGEQVSILWSILSFKFGIKIIFAHRSFQWNNEAKGRAGVHVIIIGFAQNYIGEKILFEYDNHGDVHSRKVKNINGYLFEGKDYLITKRRVPICNVPPMIKGSMPNDGGHLIFTTEEKLNFINLEPDSAKYFRPYVGGYEMLNNIERWCLWLKDAEPSNLSKMKYVLDKIKLVKEHRLKSKRGETIKSATTPALFDEIRCLDEDFLAIPEVSSENRTYIPLSYFKKEVIASNKIYMIPSNKMYVFGVMSSIMHMSWVRQFSGRLESRYSYSPGVLYNNFPWPFNPSEKQIKIIEEKSTKILELRIKYSECSLADLYNPLTMPPDLLRVHQELDKAVDLAYRPQKFYNEMNRIEFLFDLYEKYNGELFNELKLTKKKTVLQ